MLGTHNHWNERGRATSVFNADALDCPRRSVLAFALDVGLVHEPLNFH